MHVHAVMFGRRSVIAGKVFVVINDFMMALIVMIIMKVHIRSDSMDGKTSLAVMTVGMGRRSRNEAIACKSKRKAKAHEAPGKRHGFKTSHELFHFTERVWP